MVEKLNRENFELKRTADNMKRGLKAKFDDLRAMCGLEVEIEAILRAKPGSKEQQALKLFLQSLERLDVLERKNKVNKRRVEDFEDEMDDLRKEKEDLHDTYLVKFEAMQKEIDALMIENNMTRKEYKQKLKLEEQDRGLKSNEIMNVDRFNATEKTGILSRLKNIQVSNNEILREFNEQRLIGKLEGNANYKIELREMNEKHKEQFKNAQDQFDYLVKSEDQKIQGFTD